MGGFIVKGQTYVILSILFVILIAVFSVLNISEVEVNYLFWNGSSPLIFVILFSVLLGGILTTVVGSKKYISLKKENKILHKKVAQLETNTESKGDFKTINSVEIEEINNDSEQL